MGNDVPDARPALLDVAQLEALLAGTFSIGQDVGQGRDKVELVRVRLFKALLGAVEAQVLVAAAIATVGGVPSAKISQAEGLALDAAMLNGIPDPVLHLQARAMSIVAGLGVLRPDPAAPGPDMALGIALHVAGGLANLLGFRNDSAMATTNAEQAQAAARLEESAAALTTAATAATQLAELARLHAASGRIGKQDLN
ncbi:MAG: hypothetical protein M3Y04_08680 [Actinomycetota bacterium]|nr:hypothetical protein [Actinomycetota bacterium]